MPFLKSKLLTLFCYLSISFPLYAQTFPLEHTKWIDSVKKYFSDSATKALKQRFAYFNLDSSIFKNVTPSSEFKALLFFAENKTEQRPKGGDVAFAKFGEGYVNYSGIYRSAIDTPFKEEGIFQHLVTGRFSFIIKESIPLVLTYFERESNSKYFKDYRDFRIEFDQNEFQRLKARKLQNYLLSLTNVVQSPLTKPSLGFVNNQLLEIEALLNHPSIVNKHIGSRININTQGLSDTTGRNKDIILQEAKDFLAFYDSLKIRQNRLEKFRDSLHANYVKTEKQILTLKAIINGNYLDEQKKEKLESFLYEKGIEGKQELHKYFNTLYSIRKLTLGRVNPNYSDLTLKNINLKGFDFEYNRKFYFALSVGWIDFKPRDFIYSGQQGKSQFLYATKIGYGKKEGSHLFLTGFKGRKQLLSTATNPNSFEVYGLSFEPQILVGRNHRFTGEIAQSGSPNLISLIGIQEKPGFDLKDKTNRAYSLKLNSSIPRTGSRLEGFYQYRGLNYQSFTSYYSNAVLHSWYLKGNQYFFKRKLNLQTALIKNNFESHTVLSRYNGQTLYKNIMVAFKNKNWPSLSIAYMPSSQISEVGGQIYQNYFQTLSLTSSHNYHIGLAKAFSMFSYNQFYNDASDSGFLYFNAKNIYFNQNLQFSSYSATINVARSSNTSYVLTTLDAGISATIFKQSQVSLGVKVNELNQQNLKVGLYGSSRIGIPKLGEINLSIDKSYLPGYNSGLVKSDLYIIGFTRYFK